LDLYISFGKKAAVRGGLLFLRIVLVVIRIELTEFDIIAWKLVDTGIRNFIINNFRNFEG
jgi:hypothetical protein